MQTSVSANELIYLYGFIPTKEYEATSAPAAKGIDDDFELDFYVAGEITIAVCLVKEQEYNEEALKKKVEDMQWLQEKAFHHHQIVNGLHENYTVVPLKFGTIYKNEESLEQTIQKYGENIHRVFAQLEGHEEWSMKVYVDSDKYNKTVEVNNAEIEKRKKEIEELPRGKQFFAKKKIDKVIEEKAEEEILDICEELHKKIELQSVETEIKKNWEKKLTDRKDDMYWNAAYLIPAAKVEQVRQLVETKMKAAEKEDSGFVFEISGPWPPYHFANFTEAEK